MFALRLCAAMALVLFLSMWLQVERPFWAALEVGFMIQLVPGDAAVRAFARTAGTFGAGGMALLIMGLFAQTHAMVVVSLALWAGLCGLGVNLFRNNLAHGFGVAGFLTAIIVVFSFAGDGTPIFGVVVSRMTECVLAALSTASVSVLFSRSLAAQRYLSNRSALMRGLVAELGRLAKSSARSARTTPEAGDADSGGQASPNDPDPHRPLYGLVKQALATEHMRQYIRYESPQFAHFNRLARRLNYDLLALISTISSLRIYIANRRGRIDTQPLAELSEPTAQWADNPHDAAAAKQAFDSAHERIRANARRPTAGERSRSLADWVAISQALDLASRARAALIKHEMLMSERYQAAGASSPRRSEFDHPMDFKNALRNSASTLVAVGVAGLVWMNFHDQRATVILVALTAALSTLFSAAPNPVAAIQNFSKGVTAATLAAFVINFWVLPQSNSYAMLMLMLAMLPVYFISGLAMTQPALAVPGRITAVIFSLITHVENGALISFPVFIEFVTGIYGALIVTALAFKLISMVSPQKRLREQMVGVFDELARGVRGSRARFETRMYDRLNSLALAEADHPVRFSARQAVLATVNIGLEARSLLILADRVGFPADTALAIQQEMGHLRELFPAQQAAPAQIVERQRRAHALAQQMLCHAVMREEDGERWLAIRATVSAELVASALADYAAAFETSDYPHVELGNTAPSPA